MLLDVEFELQKLIDQVNSGKEGGCCNRGRLIKRFNRVFIALFQTRRDKNSEYSIEDLDRIEILLEELAEYQNINLNGIKRRQAC